MKKTIIALMALAGMAMASDFSSSITMGNAGNGGYYGGTVKLTDSFFSTSFSSEEVTELPEILTLNSISFYSRTSGNQGNKTVYLAVYEYTADSTTGTFVGLSSNTVTANTLNTALTFNFEGITINSNKQYQLLFVNTESTAENVATFDGYKAHATNIGINVHNQGSLPNGDGTYKSNGINSWEGSFIPKLTIETSVPTVPEPTTATLSLLALAGLTARRRRK